MIKEFFKRLFKIHSPSKEWTNIYYQEDEEMIGILGQLLDEHEDEDEDEDDVVMSEKVRQGIEVVYTVLVERTF